MIVNASSGVGEYLALSSHRYGQLFIIVPLEYMHKTFTKDLKAYSFSESSLFLGHSRATSAGKTTCLTQCREHMQEGQNSRQLGTRLCIRTIACVHIFEAEYRRQNRSGPRPPKELPRNFSSKRSRTCTQSPCRNIFRCTECWEPMPELHREHTCMRQHGFWSTL